MHIPEGFLGPGTWIFFWVAMIPLWAISSRKIKKNMKSRHVPLLAISSAFIFVIQMFNIPVFGGSTAHAVGAPVAAIILGPWNAVIVTSIVLVIQALLFGDGGITAIAANCFNMAFAIPFISHYVYKFLANSRFQALKRLSLAGGIAAYVAVGFSAVLTGIELGIQPLLYKTAENQALYFPYSLRVSVPVMAAEYFLFFGLVELAITVLTLKYVSSSIELNQILSTKQEVKA